MKNAKYIYKRLDNGAVIYSNEPLDEKKYKLVNKMMNSQMSSAKVIKKTAEKPTVKRKRAKKRVKKDE